MWRRHKNDTAYVLPRFKIYNFQEVLLGGGANIHFLRWGICELSPEVFSSFANKEAGYEAAHAVANKDNPIEIRVLMGGVDCRPIAIEFGTKFGG
jgi:hypothetical protein